MSTDAAPRNIDQRLDRIESMLASLVERQTIRDWYPSRSSPGWWARPSSPAASGPGSAGSTGRSGNQGGGHTAWVVSHEELLRYRKSGLLPQHKQIG